MRLEKKEISQTILEGEQDRDLKECVEYQIAVACDEFVVKIY